MATTSVQAIPIPAQGDAPNGPAQMQALALAVETRLVMVFADATDRDSKITSPSAGMYCWLRSPAAYCYYDGATWSNIPARRLVANRAARDSLVGHQVGDVAVEQDTGLSFTWDGAQWRGLWPSRYARATGVSVTGITSEVGVMRLDLPDYGCPVNLHITAQALVTKSVASDVFTMNIRNGTGQSPPALAGAVLTSTAWESGVSGYIRHCSVDTGKITGAYSVQANVGLFGGSGVGSTTPAVCYMTALVTPSWD